MQMSRIWMTGCMALVLMLAHRLPVREEVEETRMSQRGGLTLTSKYNLDDTVRQIERSLRRNGLPVVARVQPEQDASRALETHVLVLGDEGGQTPVVQRDQSQSPELPWKLLVRLMRDGRTVVSFDDPASAPVPDGVPDETLKKVRALPHILQTVLT